MRNYKWHGKQYQFEESKAPKDAVPLDEPAKTIATKAIDAAKKVLTPSNKARGTKKK